MFVLFEFVVGDVFGECVFECGSVIGVEVFFEIFCDGLV